MATFVLIFIVLFMLTVAPLVRLILTVILINMIVDYRIKLYELDDYENFMEEYHNRHNHDIIEPVKPKLITKLYDRVSAIIRPCNFMMRTDP